MNPFACTPAEAKPITASPAATVLPSTSSSRSTMPTQVAGEVELALAVDAGQLGGLAADERDAGLAADLGGALDELGDLLEVDRRPPRRSRAG